MYRQEIEQNVIMWSHWDKTKSWKRLLDQSVLSFRKSIYIEYFKDKKVKLSLIKRVQPAVSDATYPDSPLGT